MISPEQRRLLLKDTLEWARERNYTGWDYSDGMSSSVLDAIPIEHTVINLAVQESAKRAPINLRPWLGIPRRRSFKGAGLFVQANLGAYEATGNEMYLREATRLSRWLTATCRESPFGWGHNHDLETLDGTIPRNTPAIVSTAYIVRSLLALSAHEQLPFAAHLPDRVESLVTEHLSYEPCADGARMHYWANHPEPYYVINANALGAQMLVELASAFDRPELETLAEPVFDYVAACQTDRGGWYYADPADASHLSMDNHHNGFILEAFMRYQELVGTSRYDDVLDQGLAFYERELFESDGAPRWDETKAYPRDIHAAAQGIITFTIANRSNLADRILAWTIDHLYAGNGRFWYRKDRFSTRRITLMRWAQAWMAVAIATTLGFTAKPPQAMLSIPA